MAKEIYEGLGTFGDSSADGNNRLQRWSERHYRSVALAEEIDLSQIDDLVAKIDASAYLVSQSISLQINRQLSLIVESGGLI